DESISDDMTREVLLERTPYALLPEDHPLAKKDTIAPEDLAELPMVLLATPPSPDYFLTLLRDQGIEPNVAWQTNALETVRGMVANGLGFALLASEPATDLTYDGKRAVIRPLGWAAKQSRIMLVRRRDTRPTWAAERFAWLCRDHFGADLR
ncbi:MAG: LysR substrate-binding domain-containing protein, partial [Pseudomonadota bacterium]